MAFRFHLHDLSPPKCREITRYEDQLEANSLNDALAKRVDYIFYEDKETIDGYFVGGTNKHKEILVTGCPIKLTDEHYGPTPLSLLLIRAFTLLRQHYMAIDHKDLKRYAPPSLLIGHTKKTPTQEKKPLRIHVLRDLEEDDEPEHESDSNTDAKSLNPVVAVPTLPPVQPKRVLDNHRAMFNVFTGVFRDEDGEDMDVSDFKDDKTFDQFDGLKAIIGEEMKKDSGSYSKLKKRKSESSSDSPNKKPRIQQHGQNVLPGRPRAGELARRKRWKAAEVVNGDTEEGQLS
jgi:hypothetical protein